MKLVGNEMVTMQNLKTLGEYIAVSSAKSCNRFMNNSKISKGEPDVSTLSVEEQKAFYGRLLARVLDLYRQKRESEGDGNGL